jgi:predicted acylesterase/phospholipase RssA
VGGLLNNLPIDVMSGLARGGSVLAVDVSPAQDVTTDVHLATEISGWRVLLGRLNPFGSRLDVPYISTVLMRSAVVGSIVRGRSQQEAAHASLYLEVPVRIGVCSSSRR